MGILEKIKDIEDEMARTQKNKATEYHLGLLKAKLAKLRAQLLESTKKSGPAGDGFDVVKTGHARVCMIGFPSVGKSTLLTTLTHTQSAIAAYEFTTLTCIPGNIEYKGAKIQLLDLPGAAQGRGRGRQVIAVARTSDMVLMLLDASKAETQRKLLTFELESVGIKLNQSPPLVSPKTTGGVKITNTVPLTRIDNKMMESILHEYKIHNCELVIREDINVEQFIDIIDGNRKYLPCVYVYNKMDQISVEDIDKLMRTALLEGLCDKYVSPLTPGISQMLANILRKKAAATLPFELWASSSQPPTSPSAPAKPGQALQLSHRWICSVCHSVPTSCELKIGMEMLLETMWQHLDLVRVYTKRRGQAPDFDTPWILKRGCTVEDVCGHIHKDLSKDFKHAFIWGRSVKHSPQICGLRHRLDDEDVVQIVKVGQN